MRIKDANSYGNIVIGRQPGGTGRRSRNTRLKMRRGYRVAIFAIDRSSGSPNVQSQYPYHGKVCIADIANAALAGGVAIGSTCDITSPTIAFVIGALAGGLSTFGFAVIQDKLQKLVNGIDSCGVMYLHGLPGLLGGIAAVFVVDGINAFTQLKGIGISIVIALIAGYITGKILSIFGRRIEVYVDAEEFVDAED